MLVDPKFKEQFEIAHPTPRYAALLEEVPACFVGTEERLVALVELLCSEMSAAFRGTGGAPPFFESPSTFCLRAASYPVVAHQVCNGCFGADGRILSSFLVAQGQRCLPGGRPRRC